MQSLYEAASHIAQEIERTRQHLATLELALEGLRPLITIDAATNALPYTKAQTVQTVSDVSIVHDETAPAQTPKPTRKTAIAKSKSKRVPTPRRAARSGKAVPIPKTGAEVWLRALGRGKMGLDGVISHVMAALSLDASARPVIRNRAGAWLYSAAKSGVVKATTGKDGSKLYQAVR
jgi:hypothetical protein